MQGGVSSRGTVAALAQRTGCARFYTPALRKGVIAMYGDTGTRDSWYDLDDSSGYLKGPHDQGFPTASIDTGVTWGNAAVRTDMATLRTNAQASLFAAGKVHLLGVSAGGTCVLNWAKNNPTLVQSIALVIPCVDIQAVQTNNRGGFAAELTAAYGGAVADADNPAKNAASFAGIPVVIYYSSTDNITLAAETAAFATAAGASLVSMGALGHFWGPPLSGSALGDFFAAHD